MKVFLIILLIVVIIIVVSAIIAVRGGILQNETEKTVILLYESVNAGKSWVGIENIPGGNIKDLSWDNTEKKILVGTESGGILRSDIDGKNLEQYSGSLGEGTRVFDILDPATSEKFISLTFSENRGRIIKQEAKETVELLSTTLDRFAFFKGRASKDLRLIRVAGSDGGLYESSNFGGSWTVLSRFKEGLILLEVNPQNPQEIWVIDARNSFYRSRDGGKLWKDLTSALQEFREARDAGFIFFEPRSGILYHGSKYGVLKSLDRGDTWEDSLLPIPPGSASISAFASSPASGSTLFVGVKNQIYVSKDSGNSWMALNVPTNKTISSLLVLPGNPEIILAGFRN
jgi:hypothetical protein